ncbi:MAG: hypothetical protein CR984_07280 [Proteobacteria bacterium]|nr:MAG: hypothetical protein CR984_07280 [Pseudomonadota bacterium]
MWWVWFLATVPGGAAAADYRLSTNIVTRYEYTDNIFFNEDGALDDHITTVSPGVALVRHAERSTVRVDGRADFSHYRENDELDDIDQWYNASIDYRPSERWQFAAHGGLIDDNRADRDVEITGLVLGSVRRRRSNIGGMASYIFTEKTSGGLFVDFNRENYDDPDTSDRMDYSVVLFLSQMLDNWLARTTGRLNLRYSHYKFERYYGNIATQDIFEVTTTLDDRSDVDSLSLTAGTESVLTEKINLNWDLGARYSRSCRDLVQQRTYTPPWFSEPPLRNETESDRYGFVGSLALNYRGERFTAGLSASHDLQPLSGRGGTANRTRISLSGSRRFSEKLSGSASVQWYWNLSEEDAATGDETDTQTWNARVGLRWAFNRHLALSGDYLYTRSEDHSDGTEAYRNRFLLRLTGTYDWLE